VRVCLRARVSGRRPDADADGQRIRKLPIPLSNLSHACVRACVRVSERACACVRDLGVEALQPALLVRSTVGHDELLQNACMCMRMHACGWVRDCVRVCVSAGPRALPVNACSRACVCVRTCALHVLARGRFA